MRIYFILASLCLVSFSCTHNEVSPLTTINLCKDDDEIDLSSFFKTVNVIPLSEQDEYLMNGISKVRFANDLYYVLDNEGKQIVAFDGTGMQQYVYSRQGHGHNEYMYVCDFDVNAQGVYIYCVPSRIYVTDKNLNLQRVIRIDEELNITDIFCKNNIIYLYSKNTRTLYSLNDNEEIQTIINETPLPVCPPGASVFYDVADQLLYLSDGGDTVYSIKDYKATPLFTIDYPNKSESKERFKQNKLLELEEKLKYSTVAFRSIVDVGDNWFVTYTCGFLYRWCLIDKNDYSLVKDGNISTLLFPRGQLGEKVFAWGNVSIERNEADSLDLRVNIVSPINPEEGNLAIMVYE